MHLFSRWARADYYFYNKTVNHTLQQISREKHFQEELTFYKHALEEVQDYCNKTLPNRKHKNYTALADSEYRKFMETSHRIIKSDSFPGDVIVLNPKLCFSLKCESVLGAILAIRNHPHICHAIRQAGGLLGGLFKNVINFARSVFQVNDLPLSAIKAFCSELDPETLIPRELYRYPFLEITVAFPTRVAPQIYHAQNEATKQ